MVQNLKFSLALKAKKTSALHTIYILNQNTNQASHCLDFQSSIFSLSLGLDTLFFLQSILTLDRSQNYAFFRIYLHYISFALHLHFICISHSPRN